MSVCLCVFGVCMCVGMCVCVCVCACAQRTLTSRTVYFYHVHVWCSFVPLLVLHNTGRSTSLVFSSILMMAPGPKFDFT